MNRKTSVIQVFLFLLTLVMLTSVTSAEEPTSPRDLLKQHIADLQKNPDDNALREKIIKLALELKPAPAVPEEATRHMVRGQAAFKAAKEEKDFNDAIEEFKKALLYAPWLAEGYFNLGVVQDKAGQHASAIKSLKLYLLSAPDAPDTDKVKALIYEIEYRQEKAAIAAKEYKEWLKKIDGARFVWHFRHSYFDRDTTLDIRGNMVIVGTIHIRASRTAIEYMIAQGNPIKIGVWEEVPSVGRSGNSRFIIKGRQFTIPKARYCDEENPREECDSIATISEDGKTIKYWGIQPDGNSWAAKDVIFQRER